MNLFVLTKNITQHMLKSLHKPLSNFWIVNIIGWSLYYVSTITEYRLSQQDMLPYVLFWQFLIIAQGFLISLGMRQVYLRFQLDKHSLPKLLGIIFLTTIVAINIWYFLDILLDFTLKREGYTVYEYVFKNYVHLTFYWGLMLASWSVLYFVIKLWIEWQDESKRSNQAIHLARYSQLQMLRYQLNPHFLFNSLNSIRALIDENESDAQDMITELSEFLRYSLNNNQTLSVALQQEIDAIRHYFSIEKKRFEDKLDIEFDIMQETIQWPVIAFILHPLAENAIKYGMKTSEMPLRIRIKSWIQDNCLCIQMKNSGRWLDPETTKTSRGSTHTGLENMRSRLENAFPGEYKLDITCEDNWVSVEIKICKEAPEQWEAQYE